VIRIGLTGNIACGKSTVAAMLAELGAMVIDADKVAHETMRPGTECYRRVVERFGENIVSPDKSIDRKALAAIVFSDPPSLLALDQIVHPAVIDSVEKLIADAAPSIPAVVIEAVKLVEAGMHRLCDIVWVVTCSPEVALERMMVQRGLSEDEARARLDAQGSDEAKRRAAEVIIANNGDPAYTKRQVLSAWRRLTDRNREERLVKLATVAHEVLAGMIISVLKDERIPALARARGVGIGGWASGALLEHDLLVRDSDWERAAEAIQDFLGDEVTLASRPEYS
jgi:dephospho-CoA kinase